MRSRYLTVALVLFLSVAPRVVPAHDPALHGFKLVTFARPFPAPGFTVEDLSGARTELAGYRGKYVLLNFWATWCPPCLDEMPSMEVLHQRFKDRGFVVVAISSDKEGASIVQGFIDKLDVSFPILLDPDGRVARAYGAKNLPVSFLLDRQGQVIAAAQGARDWASKEALTTVNELVVGP